MLNVCLDQFLDSAERLDYQEQILTHLRELSKQWTTDKKLLIQIRDNHQVNSIEVLCSQLAVHGWPEGSYRLHRWSPIQGISTFDPINQTLRNHAACWQGSHIELCFEDKPQAIPDTLIPQALVILETAWSHNYRKKFQLKPPKRGLKKALHHYTAIAKNPSTRIGEVLQKWCGDVNWMALDQLFATVQTTASMPTSTARPTLAWVSPMPPARSGIATYAACLLPSPCTSSPSATCSGSALVTAFSWRHDVNSTWADRSRFRSSGKRRVTSSLCASKSLGSDCIDGT